MLYETIIPASGCSFTKKNFVFKHFPPDWHYHPEYELVAITEGFGKRFVGNGVSEFFPGDIALIGSNVPHFHLSDQVFYEDNDLYCSSEVIQFNLNVFPAEFRTIDEGLCVQIMHIGSYDAEPASVAQMDAYLAQNGYENDLTASRLHHEIYLSDPRKTAPEKQKTVIRHPIKVV